MNIQTAVLIAALTALGSVQEGQPEPVPAQEQEISERLPTETAAILEAQVQALREDSDRILSTALWTLGISAAFVVAVTGLLSFFSLRVGDRERRALETELKGIAAKELAALREEIARQGETLASDHQQRSAQQQEVLQASMKDIAESLESKTQLAVKKGTEELSIDVAVLKSKVATVQVRFQDFIAEYTRDHGAKTNALRAYVQLGAMALSQDESWRVNGALKEIEGLVAELRPLGSFEEGDLVEFLRRLPEEFEIQRDRITELLRG